MRNVIDETGKLSLHGKVGNLNKCEICPKQFIKAYKLKRHMQAHKRNTLDKTGKIIYQRKESDLVQCV